MTVIGLSIVILCLLYFFFLQFMAVGWKKMPRIKTEDVFEIPVSIIVPFRNEERNIEACIQSLKSQQYDESKMEVIFVNDHSDDTSVPILQNYARIKIIELSAGQQGKKAALKAGMEAASNELMITRDADTTSGPEWLKSIVSVYLRTNAKMIIAPVCYSGGKGILHAFQQLELFAVMILTGSSAFIKKPFMCNGANLAFSRTVFEEVKGYEGNEQLASGDDVFLLNKFRKLKRSEIIYLKNRDAVVHTPALASLKSLMMQRLRWLKKGRYNKNPLNAFSSLLIGGTNVSVLVLGILSLFINQLTLYFIYTAIMKCFIDFLLLFLASSYLKQKRSLWYTPLFLLVYPVYVFCLMILSFTAKLQWKGRKI